MNRTSFECALGSKAAEGRRTPRCWRVGPSRWTFRQVLECAAPAALWLRNRANLKRHRTGAVQIAASRSARSRSECMRKK